MRLYQILTSMTVAAVLYPTVVPMDLGPPTMALEGRRKQQRKTQLIFLDLVGILIVEDKVWVLGEISQRRFGLSFSTIHKLYYMTPNDPKLLMLHIVMKNSEPKVLCLSLAGSPKSEPEETCALPSKLEKTLEKYSKESNNPISSIRGPDGAPYRRLIPTQGNQDMDGSCSDTDSEEMTPPSTSLNVQPWMKQILSSSCSKLQYSDGTSQTRQSNIHSSTAKALVEKFWKLDHEDSLGSLLNYRQDHEYGGNVRDAVSLARNAPSGPPPLCSICQHKAPVFGKPPRWFSYAELELATGGFSEANFLAEGGFGSVNRGVLPDGQAVAVKQHTLASSQGDHEFCSDVEVLSCAQHRGVVMLIGFCVEDRRRLPVYEYICNSSLDSHLYGPNQQPLEWVARQKIAVGAARGLRYLHEECRVGCIVHPDMRPNNILITHDFEPLVGDFGLARWQPDGDMGVETRVIGTFGYLAPEYAQSGQITEKADVYSFGVVLVELVTSRKAVDINRPKGQSLSHASCASLCIRRDPHARPRMSQVLRILEGDIIIDSNYPSTPPGSDSGSRSGRLWMDHHSGTISNESPDVLNGKLSYEALRAAY
ncbi:non-specific serine/threonine protein kinase [Ranunculus cassubicifolius]